jgi:hypothetical protein
MAMRSPLMRFQSAADKKAALAAVPASSKVEETKAKPAVTSPPPAPPAAAARPSPKKAAVAAAPAPAAPAPAAPVAVHKVHAAHGSDDSDDGGATATAVPLARKRRVVESDSDDDHQPQTRAGPVQTEDGEEVNFSPQKDASKAGKKTRERQSPSKPAPAPARPISFASAVPIAAAPAAKKKKVVPPCFAPPSCPFFIHLHQVWVTREFRDANGFLCSEDVEEEAPLPRLSICTVHLTWLCFRLMLKRARLLLQSSNRSLRQLLPKSRLLRSVSQSAATICACPPLMHFQPKPAEKKDKVAPKAAPAAAPQKGIMSFFGKK